MNTTIPAKQWLREQFEFGNWFARCRPVRPQKMREHRNARSMNPHHRGSKFATLLPLLMAAAMMAPPDLSGPRYRAETEEEKARRLRHDAERIEAALVKRERKARRGK